MARSKINVDIILQSYGKQGTNDISFTVPLQDAEAAAEALSELQESIGFDHLSVDTNVCKVSIVGAGMMSASGIAALMFEALYDAKINIQMISTSEIKVSVLIEKGYADQAVQAIHNKFFGLSLIHISLVERAGEGLVEVAARDDVVALGILALEDVEEHRRLRGLAPVSYTHLAAARQPH